MMLKSYASRGVLLWKRWEMVIYYSCLYFLSFYRSFVPEVEGWRQSFLQWFFTLVLGLWSAFGWYYFLTLYILNVGYGHCFLVIVNEIGSWLQDAVSVKPNALTNPDSRLKLRILALAQFSQGIWDRIPCVYNLCSWRWIGTSLCKELS